MLDPTKLRHAVDMQHRSYLLLKWVASAVTSGFVSFKTAHTYSTLPLAAEAWIAGHYSNIPANARPAREDLAAFAAFFSTYLTNSFDLIANPGQQLFSPDAHCFCPMCSWLIDAPNLMTKKVTSADKRRAHRIRVATLLKTALENALYYHRIPDCQIAGRRCQPGARLVACVRRRFAAKNEGNCERPCGSRTVAWFRLDNGGITEGRVSTDPRLDSRRRKTDDRSHERHGRQVKRGRTKRWTRAAVWSGKMVALTRGGLLNAVD